MSKYTACTECGMVCAPGEYHPYAACLMFKACHDGAAVLANLRAVRNDALDAAYDAMFAIPGSKVTRFDAQTAIRKLKGGSDGR